MRMLLFGLLLWTGLLRAADDTAADTLVIVEKVAGSVGFYTLEGKRVAGVKVGTHPHEIVTSADGRYAYVSDNGILWMQYAGEGGNTISIIDLKNRTKAGVIDLGNNRRPHGMALLRNGRLLSTTENPDGLVLVDPVQKKVLRRYDVKGEDPHMVIVGPGEEWAYVSNTGTATIAAVHLKTGNVKLIPTDKRPQGGVLSHDGKLLYMTNSDGFSISIVDTAKNERVGTIKTGKGPGRVYLTPDGKTLVYNLQQQNGAGFADVAARKEVKQIDLGGKPLSLTASPDGKWAYAGLQESDKVAVISIAEQKVVRTFDTPKGAGPDPVVQLRSAGRSLVGDSSFAKTFGNHGGSSVLFGGRFQVSNEGVLLRCLHILNPPQMPKTRSHRRVHPRRSPSCFQQFAKRTPRPVPPRWPLGTVRWNMLRALDFRNELYDRSDDRDSSKIPKRTASVS